VLQTSINNDKASRKSDSETETEATADEKQVNNVYTILLLILLTKKTDCEV
jgi:hypothetical protein